MTNQIMAGVMIAIISSLLTYFISSISQRGALSNLIKQHMQIWHQDSMYKYFETEIMKHKENCTAAQKIDKIEKIVIAIYMKQGGKIEDLR